LTLRRTQPDVILTSTAGSTSTSGDEAAERTCGGRTWARGSDVSAGAAVRRISSDVFRRSYGASF